MRAAFKGRRGATLVVEGVAQATAAGMNPQIGQKPDQVSPDLSKSMTNETLSAAREGIAMAFGVLPSFLNRAATGPVVRGAQRQLAIWTLHSGCHRTSLCGPHHRCRRTSIGKIGVGGCTAKRRETSSGFGWRCLSGILIEYRNVILFLLTRP